MNLFHQLILSAASAEIRLQFPSGRRVSIVVRVRGIVMVTTFWLQLRLQLRFYGYRYSYVRSYVYVCSYGYGYGYGWDQD